MKDEFIQAIRVGIRQNCLVIHGEENILPILQGKTSFSNYVWFLYRKASSHGLATSPIDELLSLPNFKIFRANNEVKVHNDDPWTILYNSLIGDDPPKSFQGKLISCAPQIQSITDNLISIVHVIEKEDVEKLKLLISWCRENKMDSLVVSAIRKLESSSWLNLAKPDVESLVLSQLEFSGKKLDPIINKTLEYLENNYSVYDAENSATHILRPLWESMSNKQKTSTAKAYLKIFCDSSRKPWYPQKEFANKIFDIKNKTVIIEASKEFLLNEIKEQRTSEIPFLEDSSEKSIKKHVVTNLERRYRSALELLDIDKTALEKIYDKAK